MTRRTFMVGDMAFTVNEDDAPAPGLFPSAVLQTRAVDELTTAPPRVTVRLRSESTVAFTGDAPRITSRSTRDGLCGLVARTRDVAHLLLTSGGWTARLEAPGYLTHDLTAAIDRARRSVGVGVVPPAPQLQLAAPVATDADQFAPGRGVVVERNALTAADEIGVAQAVVPALPLGTIAVAPALTGAHAVGRAVAGVPMLLPDRPLHRARPITILGRAQRRTPGPGGTLVPAPAAQIAIRGVWLTYPSTTATPPVAPDFCSITPPLYADHGPGTSIELSSAAAVVPVRTLAAAAEAGADELLVAPNNLLAPLGGDRLRIEVPWLAESEIVVTDSALPSLDPTAPVTVQLRTPTAYAHRPGATVQVVAPGAFTSLGTTTREAQRGDAVVFANGLAALAATTGLVVVGRGTPFESWHVATQPPRTPNDAVFTDLAPIDVDGRFEWAAFGRVAQLRVRALHPSYVPLTIDHGLDYDGDNALSVVFIN